MVSCASSPVTRVLLAFGSRLCVKNEGRFLPASTARAMRRIACSRRSDSGARGKNLTRSPSSERLERAIRRIARAVLAGKNRQILELYKL